MHPAMGVEVETQPIMRAVIQTEEVSARLNANTKISMDIFLWSVIFHLYVLVYLINTHCNCIYTIHPNYLLV